MDIYSKTQYKIERKYFRSSKIIKHGMMYLSTKQDRDLYFEHLDLLL
jgi:hypothetical protein